MGMKGRKLLAMLLSYSAAVAVLLAVFALYTRPEIRVMLADQIWACFN